MNQQTKPYKWIGTNQVRPDGVEKVIGQAKYGADYTLPNMLFGEVLRSPHAHARIKSIHTSKAEALPGVKAVMTGADLPEQEFAYAGPERVEINFWHFTRNVMAREKALYDGHAVAAVAATSKLIARKALKLIEVEYEVLPHVIDVDDAMAPDAPLLFEDMVTKGEDPATTKPSNIAKRFTSHIGDIEKGFAEADVVIEKDFKTKPIHQGYIEPHACLVSYNKDGQSEIWSSSQGHFIVRALTSKLTGTPLGSITAYPAEIGGGFGGKTVVYVEPLALVLSKKSGRPVKLQMSREDVFRASGPTSGASMTIKMGIKKDGTITAGQAILRYQAGSVPGSPVMSGNMCAFSPYAIENMYVEGYDVVSNRPKVAAYRAPGSPIAAFGVESVIDMLCKEIGADPLEVRLKNGTHVGAAMTHGETMRFDSYKLTVEAIKNHPAYKEPLGPNQGRGIASGYWFNGAGESSATLHVNADGTAVVSTGSPDIGGSRASMAMMAAETLGIDYNDVTALVADTASVAHTHVTGGSRVTYATGLAVQESCKKVIADLCVRAAKIWDVEPEAVIWEDGHAHPASANVGDFEPLSFKHLATTAASTGGPISESGTVNAVGQAPGFATQMVDVEVDPETGKVEILRVVAAQDVGRAIHPEYVEGQIQGGVMQGVGWALNEEYIYNDKGLLDNPGFLDYRMPVASDQNFNIESLMLENPNPNHPYGVKGVGEVCICPPMAAIANAIENAVGLRFQELPMSPPRVRAAFDAKEAAE